MSSTAELIFNAIMATYIIVCVFWAATGIYRLRQEDQAKREAKVIQQDNADADALVPTPALSNKAWLWVSFEGRSIELIPTGYTIHLGQPGLDKRRAMFTIRDPEGFILAWHVSLTDCKRIAEQCATDREAFKPSAAAGVDIDAVHQRQRGGSAP